MDIADEIYKQYATLLTERNRLNDYLRIVSTDIEFICANIELDSIEFEIEEIGARLEIINMYAEIIDSLE